MNEWIRAVPIIIMTGVLWAINAHCLNKLSCVSPDATLINEVFQLCVGHNSRRPRGRRSFQTPHSQVWPRQLVKIEEESSGFAVKAEWQHRYSEGNKKVPLLSNCQWLQEHVQLQVTRIKAIRRSRRSWEGTMQIQITMYYKGYIIGQFYVLRICP